MGFSYPCSEGVACLLGDLAQPDLTSLVREAGSMSFTAPQQAGNLRKDSECLHLCVCWDLREKKCVCLKAHTVWLLPCPSDEQDGSCGGSKAVLHPLGTPGVLARASPWVSGFCCCSAFLFSPLHSSLLVSRKCHL